MSIHWRRGRLYFGFLALLCFTQGARAAGFGDVQGVVEDTQRKRISGASVNLRALRSSFSRATASDDKGGFLLSGIPLGEYSITVSTTGFAAKVQQVAVGSRGTPLLRIQLNLASISQSIDVAATPPPSSDSPTPTVVVSREAIAETPGAGRPNSLAMITDYVPGAFMTHDQLHIRGGHQVTWLVDGVPLPNTNIGSNVGPQFDPRDIDYLEVQRGGYSAEYGDRTFGVFNVMPRTGFERDREAEILASVGSFAEANGQMSLGDHNQRMAYYLSGSFNRSDYGLAAPTATILHDHAQGYGGFGSLVVNGSASNVLRLVMSARRDDYQVPLADTAQGPGDEEHESDAFLNLSWIHTFGPGVLLTASPLFHWNRTDFVGGSGDMPIPRETRDSSYTGAQVVLDLVKGTNDGRAGIYGFRQQDTGSLSLRSSDPAAASLAHQERPAGNLMVLFVEDQYRPTSWLTLAGGVRFTHFSAEINENAASPRIGGTVRLPRVGWSLHGFYGRYYQAPPLSTVSGPLLGFALSEGFGFLPLHGERDDQHEFGLTIPLRGWTLEADYFHTGARNFLDHNAIGNSSLFFPLTLERAKIRGIEASLRSPHSLRLGEVSVVYSNQIAQGQGIVTGGLTDFQTSENGGLFPLDHDQRHTLNVVLKANLPARSYVSGVVHYGSGFSDGSQPPPAHLPGHVTFDLSAGTVFGSKWTVALHAMNVSSQSFLLDNSPTFGGRHFSDPRQIYGELRYRFRY